LSITRKGGKVVTIPLTARTARAIDLGVGERTQGPLFVTAAGRRPDRRSRKSSDDPSDNRARQRQAQRDIVRRCSVPELW